MPTITFATVQIQIRNKLKTTVLFAFRNHLPKVYNKLSEKRGVYLFISVPAQQIIRPPFPSLGMPDDSKAMEKGGEIANVHLFVPSLLQKPIQQIYLIFALVAICSL